MYQEKQTLHPLPIKEKKKSFYLVPAKSNKKEPD